MARELYVMPSDVFLGKAAKSLLWVSGLFSGRSCARRGHHYTTALMDRVRDAGHALSILIDRNAELPGPEAVAAAEQRASDLEAEAAGLKSEIKAAEQRASDLEAEATRLKAEVKSAEEQNKELQVLLRTTRTEAHLARKEAATLDQKLEEALAEAKRASKALATETD
ncbi:hypothetical protein C4D60_Mb04t18760 [Musa balbisiana]|uniref:Uncharacterized protein n=1 Tax=Musa balbisiana TaxID=52838 RepID=A0A4V4H9V6_MUSBA|nr:hypothetical protein C4D60_Mb04t18760 [Musa balbisiana]